MIEKNEVLNACLFAESHAKAGLKQYPFDAVYLHALEQLSLLDYNEDGSLSAARAVKKTFDIGLMAAKELGNEEQDFAHALSLIQQFVDDYKY